MKMLPAFAVLSLLQTEQRVHRRSNDTDTLAQNCGACRDRTIADESVADSGGTCARFALADSHHRLRHVTTLACADFPGPARAIHHYLDGLEALPIRKAAIAVATAVIDDHFALTNRSEWSFSIEDLRRELSLEQLQVLNDFAGLGGMNHAGQRGRARHLQLGAFFDQKSDFRTRFEDRGTLPAISRRCRPILRTSSQVAGI